MNTIIKPLPNDAEIESWVDRLVTPENADAEAFYLARLVLAVADADNDDLWHLANVAARRAFEKTTAFEESFRRFAGYPENRAVSAPEIVSLEKEQ